MKNLKSSVLFSTLFSVSAIFATAAHADAAQDIAKSTNVKSAIVNACKAEMTKGKKLTAAEVNKYCTCAIDADGKVTNAQKWEIQSTINQKKSPSTLAFVQKQNAELKACFGPQLTTKLGKLSEEAMQEAQAKAAAAKK